MKRSTIFLALVMGGLLGMMVGVTLTNSCTDGLIETAVRAADNKDQPKSPAATPAGAADKDKADKITAEEKKELDDLNARYQSAVRDRVTAETTLELAKSRLNEIDKSAEALWYKVCAKHKLDPDKYDQSKFYSANGELVLKPAPVKDSKDNKDNKSNAGK